MTIILRCSACGECKNETDFHRAPWKARNGRAYKCKPCVTAYNRREWQTRRSAVAAKSAAYYRANAGKIKQRAREYEEANKAAVRERSKQYKRKRKLIDTAWKEKLRRQARERVRRPEVAAKIKAALGTDRARLLNRLKTARYLARKKSVGGTVTITEWEAIEAGQDGRCAHCGRHVKLEMDHVIPLSKGGPNVKENIQGLCRPCNASKADREVPLLPAAS
jgi:5-methylcytosine-specific restriction endonuclease McrA